MTKFFFIIFFLLFCINDISAEINLKDIKPLNYSQQIYDDTNLFHSYLFKSALWRDPQNYEVTFITPLFRQRGQEYARFKLNQIIQAQKNKYKNKPDKLS